MATCQENVRVKVRSRESSLRRRSQRRLALYGFLGLLMTGLAGATPPGSFQGPGRGSSFASAAPVSTDSAANPMDAPCRLIAEAAQSFQGIRDYTCLFVKRERLRGQLQPDNLIAMKARNQPFSVYLRWLGPQQFVGQEACYVDGGNGGNMRVHATGFRAIAGFVSVPPNDPRVMENSLHPITDAGIGNLIRRYSERWESERRMNQTVVQVADYEFNHRPCTRVETLHPNYNGSNFYAYRSVMYLDKENHLPIRVESYSPPRSGGPAGGDLFESYSYVNLRFNLGLKDDAFAY